jgi:hypothetical protein
MNSYFAKLNPSERRFVVGVTTVLFLVVNIFFVWPHFSDWDMYQTRLARAQTKLTTYQTAINQVPRMEAEVKKMQSEGSEVPPEDQATDFLRTIQAHMAQTGVGFVGNSRQIGSTNLFFMEQRQTIQVQATDQQLVNFLYTLGSGNSLIRVRDLSVRPDPNHYTLNASITLMASYQKKTPAKSQPGKAASPIKK